MQFEKTKGTVDDKDESQLTPNYSPSRNSPEKDSRTDDLLNQIKDLEDSNTQLK